MCQMSIVVKRGEETEVVLENAALLEVAEEGVIVNALFEQPKLIRGAFVKKIDFMQGKVTLGTLAGKD